MNSTKSVWLVMLVVLTLLASACATDVADEADVAGNADPVSDDAVEGIDPAVVGSDDVMEVDLPGSGKTAHLGRAPWRSGYVSTQILAELLTELGYDVSSPDGLEFAPDVAYEAMASGDLDLWSESWYPGHLSWWEGDLPDGTAVGDHLTRLVGSGVPGGGLQGMLVTKSWAEAEGITTLDQINDDEALWSQLDSDGNGKGEVYGCPLGSTCDVIMAQQIAYAGWEHLEKVPAGYDAMFSEFLTRAEAGEPAIIYMWTPTAYFARSAPGVTTMWLSVENSSVLDDSNPLGLDGGAELSQYGPDGTPGHTALGDDVCLHGPDGCQLGWVAADIEVTANREWLADNPAVEALAYTFHPPLMDIAMAELDLANSAGSQADVVAIALAWIADNRALVDAWLTEARAAA